MLLGSEVGRCVCKRGSFHASDSNKSPPPPSSVDEASRQHTGLRDQSAETMAHCHDEHGGHGHDHGHDHSDDVTPALQSSLYEQISFDEITTLNESRRDAGKAVVRKTWAERMDVEPELVSDADEQLLMTVP